MPATICRGSFRLLVQRLLDQLRHIDEQVGELQRQIVAGHRANEQSRRLAEVPGIGPITASAIVATVADARSFDNGRQAAAWMGLVPRQHSSGGKSVLLGISKRGDSYLRTLLIHGARYRTTFGRASLCGPRFYSHCSGCGFCLRGKARFRRC